MLEQEMMRFANSLAPEDLDPTVCAAVGVLLRQELGAQLGVSRQPWSKEVLAFVRDRGEVARSRVVGSALRMKAADAAFVNAWYAHAAEFGRGRSRDEGRHVVALALALGEQLGVSVGAVVAAIVAGYEVSSRVGRIVAPDLVRRRINSNAVLGMLGASIVVAKLRGLESEKAQHTVGIALSLASGTSDSSSTAGSMRYLQHGICFRNALYAAELAESGITAPRGFFTGTNALWEHDPGQGVIQVFDMARPFEIVTDAEDWRRDDEKFFELVTGVLGPQGSDKLFHALHELDTTARVANLMALCAVDEYDADSAMFTPWTP
jgi:2-methylcitrate dehydratase PrpD